MTSSLVRRTVAALPLAAALAFLTALPPARASAQETARVAPHPAGQPVYDTALYAGLDYRMVGPYRGGRVTAVAGVPHGDHRTFYMGATGGGVWKTTNTGLSWSNVSDGGFGVGSIGAIAVASSDANVVYVGTGSWAWRGNVSTGDGLYRSTDAGKTWARVGLEDAGSIGAVRVDPNDPDRVYVAALGHPFGPNPTRGVFRSEDGGTTWKKVLFISDSTGVADLSMDPANPRVLYAAAWTSERKPWTIVDGSREGGIWKSTDGGDHWTKLSGGLPDGLLGKIGVAVSPADPDRVYAVITAKEPDGGIWRSDDAGKTWRHVSSDHELTQRGWYYSRIIADPQDPNTVYIPNVGFWRSDDAGKTWQRVRTRHGDNHSLWIDPSEPKVMIEGNDGGAHVTTDGGKTWSTLLNQPTAQFYRVTVDNGFPYRLYGAQQDLGTISVPAWSSGGISPQTQWLDLAGGESGYLALDPDHPDLVYSGSYLGVIDRVDRTTGKVRDVIAYPELTDGVAPKDLKYRFQWNAPILMSRFDSSVVYHAAQVLLKSTDEGRTWTAISPDLTRHDTTTQAIPGGPVQHDHTGVEIYGTIFALAEGTESPDVLWAGSDDGLVHLTRDGGKTWKDVTPPGLPAYSTVNVIAPSPHQAGQAYVTAYRYRMDDWHPYVYETKDWGAHWTRIADGTRGIPAGDPVRVVREDPVRAGLLYAGTEFGMYVSFDDGAHWQTLQQNLPPVPVTDLTVHGSDLVLATQGRSFWILDDVTPLRQLTGAVAKADHYLFEPRAAYRASFRGFRGSEAPESPPGPAVFDLYLASAPAGEVSMEVVDPQGRVAARWSTARKGRSGRGAGSSEGGEEGDFATAGQSGAAAESGDFASWATHSLDLHAGENRLEWDLHYPGPHLVKGAVMDLGYTGGPWAVPGTYTVRVKGDGWSLDRSFDVRKDPRYTDVTPEDLQAEFDLATRVRDSVTAIHDAVRALRSAREQVGHASDRVAHGNFPDSVNSRVKMAADSLRSTLSSLAGQLHNDTIRTGEDGINYPPRIDNHFDFLYGHIHDAYGRPTEGSRTRFADLNAELEPIRAEVERALTDGVSGFNELLRRYGVPPVVVPAEASGPAGTDPAGG